jgi:Fuc2NAc and GlcNAc transferase
VVPKGGGIGILAAFLLSAWVLEFPILFWVSIGLISFFSFYGDRREIPVKIRLCLQLVGGTALSTGLFYWQGRGWPAYLLIPFFSVFIAGTANYYNFMDGINGIAGITGIVGFGLVVLFSALSGYDQAFLVLAVCMVFACLGFLPFNMPKARVFMGDAGSILLGFVFASLVVGLSQNFNDFVVLCSFLFPFYADELTTEYTRLRDGENLLKPHRRHIYQLLANELGVLHWKVSVEYGVLQAVVGLAALGIRGYGTVALVLFLGCCFALFWAFSWQIRKRAEADLAPAQNPA